MNLVKLLWFRAFWGTNSYCGMVWLIELSVECTAIPEHENIQFNTIWYYPGGATAYLVDTTAWVTIFEMVCDHPGDGGWPSLRRLVTIFGKVGDHPWDGRWPFMTVSTWSASKWEILIAILPESLLSPCCTGYVVRCTGYVGLVAQAMWSVAQALWACCTGYVE